MIGPLPAAPDGHTPRYYERRRQSAMNWARHHAYLRDKFAAQTFQAWPMRDASAEQVVIRVRQARRLNWQAIRARRGWKEGA